MQTVAEMWLVLQLTHSGVAVGVAAALQFAPMLLGGAWGGLIADRFDKRRLLIATQTAMALPALALLALTATGAIELWMLYALICARGAVNAVDNPARQAFLVELVGPDRLVNAVSLGSALVNGARTIGPALAGIVIATVGVVPCFALNALSFAAMILALRGMDPAALRSAPPAARRRGPGAQRAALRARDAGAADPARADGGRRDLHVQLPDAAAAAGDVRLRRRRERLRDADDRDGARRDRRRDRERRALARAPGAAGRRRGRLRRARGRRRRWRRASALAALALVPVGAASVVFAASVNSFLQLAVAPHMRGRVMALYSVVFLGSTPIGGPLMGWIAGAAGPRAALALGGLVALGAAAWARTAFARVGLAESPRRAAAG